MKEKLDSDTADTLKVHGNDVGLIQFFLYFFWQCDTNAFLMVKWNLKVGHRVKRKSWTNKDSIWYLILIYIT